MLRKASKKIYGSHQAFKKNAEDNKIYPFRSK
jgi:hypothetical protein